MNSYELYRSFFDWCFENPQKVTPSHVAIYCFSVEHCNRLGWKRNFGLPTTMVMEAVGMKSYNTYSKAFNDLVEFGFITLVEKSKNQYSANIIALSKFNKALDKALDKALIKHNAKQVQSTQQSIDSINKQLNNKQLNKYTIIQLEGIDFSSFDNSEILNVWLEWLNFKWEQFSQEYKNPKSNQKAVNNLFKLSNGKTEIARMIVDQSISNLYKGLFKLKQEFKSKNYDDNFKREDGSIDHDAKRQAFVDRVLGRDPSKDESQKSSNFEDIGFVDVTGK
jgi:DNA-binding transcriptional regulator YhcF (GntR family)